VTRINIGIYGGTGYSGYELIRILNRHRYANIKFITSESYAGKNFSEVFSCFYDYDLIPSEKVNLDDIDIVFLCLPHATAMDIVASVRKFSEKIKIIDLSADFRLDNAQEYEKWYKTSHNYPYLLKEKVYGLTEINRERIKNAWLVANPGCYPTSVLLGTYPLLKHQLVDSSQPIIIDSKSGVSGAGRKATLTTSFVEVNENLTPYNIGHVHRHTGEIEQELKKISGEKISIIFSPHLFPISTGMLSTIYVRLSRVGVDYTDSTLIELYRDTYKNEKFIKILDEGQVASVKHTLGTNYCAISLKKLDASPYVIIVSSIDNLIKGAAGQAVQNMNMMFCIEETEGLL